jgi:hypothetical protein
MTASKDSNPLCSEVIRFDPRARGSAFVWVVMPKYFIAGILRGIVAVTDWWTNLQPKECNMKKDVLVAAVLGFVVLTGARAGHAERWEKISFDVPNKNLEANYYDADSVKAHSKTIYWTEKFMLTSLGRKSYTKHIEQYPVCREAIKKRGEVVYHQIDFEIKDGKFRTVAKRNYSKDNKVLCTDKDMGTEFDKKWYEIIYKSPMYERHYLLATKYKIPDVVKR